jgi:hypothetical protein
MYIWREIQTKAGFTEDMITLRNAMAREMNLFNSPQPEKQAGQERRAQELEVLKNNRIRIFERLANSIARSKVQVNLLQESLVPNPDFEIAERYVRYFELDIEDLGKDLYIDLKSEDGLYLKLIEKEEFSTAWKFLDFFPLEDAQFELKYLFETASVKKLDDAILTLLHALSDLRYKTMRHDQEMQRLLVREYERAERDKRLDHAQRIVQYIDGQEFLYRMQAMIALSERNFQEAIQYLQRIQDKSSLRNMIIDCYWEDIKSGESDIEAMERAYAYAIQGGLQDEEDAQYLQFPAGKIFEHYMLNLNSREKELTRCEEVLPHCDPDFTINVFARKFLDLLGNGEMPLAQHIKQRFRVKFPAEGYEGEKAVTAMHTRLTETGTNETGKGETNLETALELVELFDFPRAEVSRLRILVCKYFISQRKFTEAKPFYVKDDPDLTEYLENELYKMAAHQDPAMACEVINELGFRFSKQTRSVRRAEILAATANKEAAPSVLVRSIALDDMMDLRTLDHSVYKRLLESTFEDNRGRPEDLVSLAKPLTKKFGAPERIYLHQHIEELHDSNTELAQKLERAFDSILPPNIFDWLIYIIMRIFGLL